MVLNCEYYTRRPLQVPLHHAVTWHEFVCIGEVPRVRYGLEDPTRKRVACVCRDTASLHFTWLSPPTSGPIPRLRRDGFAKRISRSADAPLKRKVKYTVARILYNVAYDRCQSVSNITTLPVGLMGLVSGLFIAEFLRV